MKIVIRKFKNYKMEKNLILNDVLKNVYKISSYQILYSGNGKPYINGSKIKFNISNDKDYILMVFDFKEVGADIQFFNPINKNFKKLIFRENLSDRDAIIDFSKREAVIKLLGLRLESLNEIDISKYKITTYSNVFYTINIAQYNGND